MSSAKLQIAIAVALLAGSFGLGRLVARNHFRPAEGQLPVDGRAAPILVDALSTTSLDGESRTVELTGRNRPLLLLVFSVDCPYCLENMPAWVELSREIARRHEGADVIALSASDGAVSEAFLERHGLDVPVRLIDAAAFRSLGLDGVPSTIVVSPATGLQRIWSGVLSPAARGRVLEGWRDARSAAGSDPGGARGDPADEEPKDCCSGPVAAGARSPGRSG